MSYTQFPKHLGKKILLCFKTLPNPTLLDLETLPVPIQPFVLFPGNSRLYYRIYLYELYGSDTFTPGIQSTSDILATLSASINKIAREDRAYCGLGNATYYVPTLS